MKVRLEATLKVAVFVALGVVSILAGCDGDGPKPVPAEYVLYAGVHGGGGSGNAYVAIIDCQTDSIIDSFPVPAREIMSMSASSNGKYLATNERWIWNIQTQTQAATIQPPFGGGLFLPGATEFLAPQRDSTGIYSIPDFSPVCFVQTELTWAAILRDQPLVLGIDGRSTHESPGPNLLRVLDYETREIIDSIEIIPQVGWQPMWIANFVLSPDGTCLYALGGTDHGPELIGYDLERREILFRRAVFSPCGFCRVTPDGKEVWLTDACVLDAPGWPPYIFILDALTGTSLDSIDMRGFYPDSIPGYQYRSLEPQDIRFHPDGEKAYVYCGRILNGHLQPLLVIDTRKREVVKTLLDMRSWQYGKYDFTYLVESIDIGPKP